MSHFAQDSNLCHSEVQTLPLVAVFERAPNSDDSPELTSEPPRCVLDFVSFETPTAVWV